ncbi:MAG: hypothetical protein C0483_04850 [Pirellula sp.]|nr:hypothetical protein [Pirellula sp.]
MAMRNSELLLSSYGAAVTSRSPSLRPEWLYYNRLRDAILGEYAAKTPGLGIIYLTAKLLRRWPIPLAPIEEQDAVAKTLATATTAQAVMRSGI